MRLDVRAVLSVLCWLVALLAVSAVGAQPMGTQPSEQLNYFMHYYKPDEYGYYTQNWSIAEDARGMIYVANNDGVLEFDGASWRLIRLTDDDITISVASDSAGRIYAAGSKEIGYLALGDSGRMAFQSITHLVPDSLRDFSYVWSIQVINGLVYYQSVKQIMRWNPRTNALKVWTGDFQVGTRYGNYYYIRHRGEGLMRIEGDELKLVPGGELFADHHFRFIIPLEAGRSVVTHSSELMLYDGKSFKPFANEAESYLRKHVPYAGCSIDSGLFAIATFTGGVVILDAQGRWRHLFDKSTGLLSNDINFVFKSKSGGLWVATLFGLGYIDYPSPLTQLSAYDLQAQFIMRQKGQLMLGCIQGLRMLQPGLRQPAEARALEGSPSNILTMLAHGDQLLTGSEIGLSIQGAGFYNILIDDLCHYIVPLADGKRLAAACTESVYLIEQKAGGWVTTDTLPVSGLNEFIHLLEHPAGVLWAGTRDGMIFKYDLRKRGKPEVVRYDTARIARLGGGLPQDFHFILVGNDLLVYTSLGLLQYDAQADRFVPDDRFGNRFTSGRWGIFAIEADRWWSGRYWIAAYTKQTTEYRIFRATRTRSGIYELQPSRFGVMGRIKVMSLFSEADGVLWVGTDKGLARYDQKFEPGFEQAFPAVVRSVRAGSKQLFNGTATGTDGIPAIESENAQPFRIAYRDNTIRFEYASLFYVQPILTEYQNRLVGFEEEWSPWSRELFKEYTNLPEGNYTFEVRARNVYGVVSTVASQRLVILPPWYRTWWAYSLFGLAFTGLIYGLFRWRLRALAEANRQLETKVEERTAEVVRQSQQLEQQNHEIVRQKEEIEYQNQEITDSIKYASRIQEAILPSRLAIAQAFPNSFVLYKPKDIVSGDFYWFADEGNWRLLAAVDCTGHGIPGAFMSVLGSSLLNQIVSEKRITDPGTILNRLNDLVRENLHQVDSKSESKDGMDLMLLAFPPEADRVLYAGANNPLYLIRGGELTEFKAHKYPIGGGQYEGRHFETSELALEDGDVLYIFSDGYADQFGGPNRRKFMYGKFKKLLLRLHQRPMAEQREVLDHTIEAWRAESAVEQIDDILVIGLRAHR